MIICTNSCFACEVGHMTQIGGLFPEKEEIPAIFSRIFRLP